MNSNASRAVAANLQRAQYFLEIHAKAKRGPGAPTLAYRELPRAAVVFAVGALDTYLCELSAEVLLKQLQSGPASPDQRDVLRRVHQELPTLALEVALLGDAAERLERVRSAVADHFMNQTSQFGAKGVAATTQRIGGKPADVWSALGSVGFADPQGELDRWTEIRHQVVHQGKKPSVRRPEAAGFIELVEAIVNELERVRGRVAG